MDAKSVPDHTPDRMAASLLAWYDRARRDLPWRAAPGRRADPYHVWLSEIMLQQTTVATVGPYFWEFLSRWPTVRHLAAASLDDVLHAWQGLGYYARARNLHRCAVAIVADHDGCFPEDESGLRALPGIGSYTAAAVAAIAFDRPATVVDGNVERVMARVHAVEAPLPRAKNTLRTFAAELTPARRAGDYAQAVMDLGATICTPRRPRCGDCPWAGACRAHKAGIAGDLPRRAPAKVKPVRQGVVFWTWRADRSILLRRRPEKGLLGGMMEVPSTEWRDRDWPLEEALSHAPTGTDWSLLPGIVRHTFTHFHLELQVLSGRCVGRRRKGKGADEVWVSLDALSEHALPTVMKKVVRHAVDQYQDRPDRKSK